MEKENGSMSEEEILPGYARVTDILKPFSNFSFIKPEVLANAADRGTRVHDYCTNYANNIFITDIDEDCKPYVESFISWYDEHVYKLVESEKRLYHKQHKFTGKFDMIVKMKSSKDAITLLDIKTPLRSSRAWGIQLAAYSILMENNFSYIPEQRLVLQVSNQGKMAKTIEYLDHKKDESLFMGALNLHNHFNPSAI